jgi:hypothetical protein
MKNKPDPALSGGSCLFNEIKKRTPKSHETIPFTRRAFLNIHLWFRTNSLIMSQIAEELGQFRFQNNKSKVTSPRVVFVVAQKEKFIHLKR